VPWRELNAALSPRCNFSSSSGGAPNLQAVVSTALPAAQAFSASSNIHETGFLAVGMLQNREVFSIWRVHFWWLQKCVKKQNTSRQEVIAP
jgi:hypothetical protein